MKDIIATATHIPCPPSVLDEPRIAELAKLRFDPARRLVPLLEASTSPRDATLAAVTDAIAHSGKVPGIFLDEDDALEVRWILVHGRMVVNATFGKAIEAYVFDRGAGDHGDIIASGRAAYSEDAPGAALARLVKGVCLNLPGAALVEALER